MSGKVDGVNGGGSGSSLGHVRPVDPGKWGEALQAAGLPPKDDPYKPPRPFSPGPPPQPPTPPK